MLYLTLICFLSVSTSALAQHNLNAELTVNDLEVAEKSVQEKNSDPQTNTAAWVSALATLVALGPASAGYSAHVKAQAVLETLNEIQNHEALINYRRLRNEIWDLKDKSREFETAIARFRKTETHALEGLKESLNDNELLILQKEKSLPPAVRGMGKLNDEIRKLERLVGEFDLTIEESELKTRVTNLKARLSIQRRDLDNTLLARLEKYFPSRTLAHASTPKVVATEVDGHARGLRNLGYMGAAYSAAILYSSLNSENDAVTQAEASYARAQDELKDESVVSDSSKK